MSPVKAVKEICLGCGNMVEERVRGRGVECCSPEFEAALNAAKNSRPITLVYKDGRWEPTRQVVFERDGHTCCGCGRHRAELRSNESLLCDHKDGIALVLAEGRDPFDPDECQALCSTCSGEKDGKRSRAEGPVL